jgi:hypothetical protein
MYCYALEYSLYHANATCYLACGGSDGYTMRGSAAVPALNTADKVFINIIIG